MAIIFNHNRCPHQNTNGLDEYPYILFCKVVDGLPYNVG